MLRRRARVPTDAPVAPPSPTKPPPRAHAHASRHTLALLAVAAVAASAWCVHKSGGWRVADPGAPQHHTPPSPPRVTPADAAAAADELAAAAAPSVDYGPSGYVTEDEWAGATFNETAFRARAARAVRGAFVADAAALGLHRCVENEVRGCVRVGALWTRRTTDALDPSQNTHSVPSTTIARLLADAGKQDMPEFWTPHAGPYKVSGEGGDGCVCGRVRRFASSLLITPPTHTPQHRPTPAPSRRTGTRCCLCYNPFWAPTTFRRPTMRLLPGCFSRRRRGTWNRCRRRGRPPRRPP